MEGKVSNIHSSRPRRKSLKIILWVFAGVLIFAAVAYLGISAYAASVLSKPVRIIDTEKYNPGTYGLKYEDVTLQARGDGLQIAAWYLPSSDNQRAIILVHGYNDSRTHAFADEFVSFAGKLHDAGFSVMMIDLRGHGESADARFTFGIKERQDVLGAVDWLKAKGYSPGKIGVLGYSLGAGSIIGAAADDPAIGAVWADSLFADIDPVLENGWVGISGLPQVFLYSTKAMIRLFYGYDISASRPIDDVSRLGNRPIFLAHCQQDELIPVSNMDQILNVLGNAQTWVIPNCDIHTSSLSIPGFKEIFNNHAFGYPLNPDEYSSKVIQFFDTSL